MTKLFIYGSLKKGHYNHTRFGFNKSTFLGEACTLEKYKLLSAGWFPVMVEAEPGTSIQGEIWEVEDDCLKYLDCMELDSGYARKPVELKETGIEGLIETYLYQGSTDRFTDVGSCWDLVHVKS